MPPRLQPPSRAVRSILRLKRSPRPVLHSYSTTTAVPSPSPSELQHEAPPIVRFPATQPPSYKPAEFRKSQLLRQYASLLRSTPLMLLFQHNSLKSNEWVSIRRELTKALQKVDETRAAAGSPDADLAAGVKIQIVQTGIFAAALRVVEFYTPDAKTAPDGLTHVLSQAAHEAAVDKRTAHALAPLMAGPLVVLSFPGVSPQHLAAALSILAPNAPRFPAPTRKANPGYYDGPVQIGLQKLLLLGARVEGRVFDVEGTRWVGGIEGGFEGMRGQLVGMLQGVGGAVTSALESASRSLYFTVESRRGMLEDEAKGDGEVKKE